MSMKNWKVRYVLPDLSRAEGVATISRIYRAPSAPAARAQAATDLGLDRQDATKRLLVEEHTGKVE